MVPTNKPDRNADEDRPLEIVSGNGDIEVELGPGIEPEALMRSFYASLARDIGKCRNPLDAELGMAEWLAMITAMIENGSPAESHTDVTASFLGTLVDEATSAKTTQGLALLRALSALPATPVTEVADAAAAELAAAGVPDRTWVTTMTKLEPSTCLRYGHVDGSQESLILGFRYGTREHAITVLIDHDLGGGMKDCWLSDAPTVIRDQITQMGRFDPEIEVGPLDWVTAEAVVAEALSRPTCAVDDEQIDDLLAYLPLLRRRMAHIAGHPWQPSGLAQRRATARPTKQAALWDDPSPSAAGLDREGEGPPGRCP